MIFYKVVSTKQMKNRVDSGTEDVRKMQEMP
jgi:hypothetical protein